MSESVKHDFERYITTREGYREYSQYPHTLFVAKDDPARWRVEGPDGSVIWRSEMGTPSPDEWEIPGWIQALVTLPKRNVVPLDPITPDEFKAIVTEALAERLVMAHRAHSDWPNTLLGGAAAVAVEAGELQQAVKKNKPVPQIEDEAFDTAAAAIWFIVGSRRGLMKMML